MKEYKYTINGNKYEVAIGDIEDNIATVTVNGEEYKVEMEKEAEPEKKKVVVARPAAKAEAPASAPAAGSAPRRDHRGEGCRRRRSEGRRHRGCAGSHEDGQQPGR